MRHGDATLGQRCQPAVTRRLLGILLAAALGCAGEPAAPPSGLRLELTPEVAVLAAGDIVLVAAVAMDELGTPVAVGPVALSTDDPSVAVIDATSRLRAVSTGRTYLRGEANGLADSVLIQVMAAPALFGLERLDGHALPLLVAADSVDWGDTREYHEVFVVSGALALVGGAEPRYELLLRYEEYAVRYVGEQRDATLRLRWQEYDRGTVAYDGRGDLAMTSEIIAPLQHRSAPISGGFVVDFRVPGTDEWLGLYFRR